MKTKLLIILSIAALCFSAAPAMADMNIAPSVGSLDIDFRTAAWSGAYNQTSYTVGNVMATALPQESKLYQDSDDGLGVLGGEPDEIDMREQLQIDIDGGMNLIGVWLTDIFTSNDGNPDGEEGDVLITLTNDSTQQFFFNGYWPLGTNNGELWVPFGDTYNVKQLLFSSVLEDNDEYSVAGAVVPIPGAVLLGILGLSAAGIKLRKFA